MNTLVEQVVEHVPTDVFTDTTLRYLIKGTNARRYGLVKRALKSGQIMHLRRGVYALAKRFQRNPCNLYEIAQKIYGPSYISFESALSYHKWIPEAVYIITNASFKRAVEIETPLGQFSYIHIPSERFFYGVQRVKVSNGVFLMATPWRALVDYIYFHKKKWRGLKPLIDNLRIDEDNFHNVDFRLLEELSQTTRNVNVKKFIDSIKKELLV